MNWNNFSFIDLFAGIGGIRLGFESVGGHCVFSSEFDETVFFMLIHPKNRTEKCCEISNLEF